ncbi:MAG: glycosyltransferase [Verrucomicrobia bacterium]|nr:glycosyltransferase [Verrucomicrobiota bacterium]
MTIRRAIVRRLSYIAVARIPGSRAHSIQIAKTCEALARRLEQVELVTPRLSGATRMSPEPDGVRLVRLRVPDFLPLGRWAPQWLMRLLFDVQSALFAVVALVRALSRRRVDFYYTRSPFVALAFATAFGGRVVLELHLPPRGRMRRALLRVCRWWGCRFVAISDTLRGDVALALHSSPDAIGMAHDGHDPAFFGSAPDRGAIRARYGLPGDGFAICYAGSVATIGAAKGVRHLVAAFQLAAIEGATLVLAGVDEGAVGAPLAGVRPLGLLAPVEVGSLLAACDAALLSFPDDPAYARAMSPLKLFEYLGAGLPMIAPDLPNLREVLDDTCAVLVPLQDSGALAVAMRRLACEPALRRALSRAALQRGAAYTWDARAERLLRFLESTAA